MRRSVPSVASYRPCVCASVPKARTRRESEKPSSATALLPASASVRGGNGRRRGYERCHPHAAQPSLQFVNLVWFPTARQQRHELTLVDALRAAREGAVGARHQDEQEGDGGGGARHLRGQAPQVERAAHLHPVGRGAP